MQFAVHPLHHRSEYRDEQHRQQHRCQQGCQILQKKIDCSRHRKQYYHLFSYNVFTEFSPVHSAHSLFGISVL